MAGMVNTTSKGVNLPPRSTPLAGVDETSGGVLVKCMVTSLSSLRQSPDCLVHTGSDRTVAQNSQPLLLEALSGCPVGPH